MAETEIIYSANDDCFAGSSGRLREKGFGGSANAERDGVVRNRPVARFARRHIASDNRGHGRGSQLAGAATSGFENIDEAPARLRDEGWHLR
jgi:pimeloyl-ACP methyl ester carboxylesterase